MYRPTSAIGKLHAVPSYKEHLYKERLVEHKSFKEQTLVNFEWDKEHVP